MHGEKAAAPAQYCPRSLPIYVGMIYMLPLLWIVVTTPRISYSSNCTFRSWTGNWRTLLLTSGRNACAQKCFFGMCNMNCASSKLCSQSCVWKAKCRHIKCSASTCNQVCTNCTMECVKGVERCDQMCLGGECRMECFAQHCKRQCSKGKCYYIGQSQSKAPIIYDWIWTFTTVAFMLLLNTWKIHNQLRKQPTFREATTSFAAKWSLSNEN